MDPAAPSLAASIRAIVARHGGDASRLVQILHDVTSAHGWVPPAAVTELARALALPRGNVEGVVAFYGFFDAAPRGAYRVRFSDNVTDVMGGSEVLRARMLAAFDVRLGAVSDGGLVSIDTTSCTGLSDQGPAMLVNDRAIGRLTAERVDEVSALIRRRAPLEAWPAHLFVVESHIERRGVVLASSLSPGEAITASMTRGAAATLDEITRSGLRGRGGAGFSTGAKWAACAAAPGPHRVIVCNADEGEPGTFKDRELLTLHAELVIEGMTVAAYVVGATAGFVYLRAEYPFLVEPLRAAIDARRRQGLLGASILGASGFDFDIDLHVGAGAYVCGEESALLESLEGRRGIPRNRPPYPVTHGYMQRPTVVNNVETLASAALVAAHGADVIRAVGTAESAGTKILSVSGDVARPGTYELPFGVRVSEVLSAAGARDVQAVQVGGPSGVLLSAAELERRIAFEDVPSAGAFMVFDAARDIPDVVARFARFFAHESCGFCTPCRVGTTLSARLLDRVTTGRATRRDLDDLVGIERTMRATSHCGLGASAGNPLRDGLAKFRDTFDAKLRALDVVPAFDLDAALAPARAVAGRDDAGAHLDEEAP